MKEKKIPHEHDNKSGQVIGQMPKQEDIAIVADLMKQLGDPSRLRIFWILCHVEECVIDIAAMAGMSSSAVSHHLRILKSGGLITSRRAGKEMYYKIADTDIAERMHRAVEDAMRISCPSDGE